MKSLRMLLMGFAMGMATAASLAQGAPPPSEVIVVHNQPHAVTLQELLRGTASDLKVFGLLPLAVTLQHKCLTATCKINVLIRVDPRDPSGKTCKIDTFDVLKIGKETKSIEWTLVSYAGGQFQFMPNYGVLVADNQVFNQNDDDPDYATPGNTGAVFPPGVLSAGNTVYTVLPIQRVYRAFSYSIQAKHSVAGHDVVCDNHDPIIVNRE